MPAYAQVLSKKLEFVLTESRIFAQLKTELPKYKNLLKNEIYGKFGDVCAQKCGRRSHETSKNVKNSMFAFM